MKVSELKLGNVVYDIYVERGKILETMKHSEQNVYSQGSGNNLTVKSSTTVKDKIMIELDGSNGGTMTYQVSGWDVACWKDQSMRFITTVRRDTEKFSYLAICNDTTGSKQIQDKAGFENICFTKNSYGIWAFWSFVAMLGCMLPMESAPVLGIGVIVFGIIFVSNIIKSRAAKAARQSGGQKLKAETLKYY